MPFVGIKICLKSYFCHPYVTIAIILFQPLGSRSKSQKFRWSNRGCPYFSRLWKYSYLGEMFVRFGRGEIPKDHTKNRFKNVEF